MKTGKVWLVGAGPGDVRLLTVKGKEALEEAEVIVYDHLVNKDLLAIFGQGKELINVGKQAGHHLIPQEEIQKILKRKAREGKRVVRLKGGDPFLFGRGGEEAKELADAGIDFEIVPGVTSALAVPAYQGIPVTHGIMLPPYISLPDIREEKTQNPSTIRPWLLWMGRWYS